MVLADLEAGEADLLGEYGLVDKVAVPFGVRAPLARERIREQVAEGEQADIHGRPSCRRRTGGSQSAPVVARWN